jgi:uncharacterized repeat protein (TIGR03803 family)
VIAQADDFGPPSGLVEAAPGLFYSNGGSARQVIFSITAGGTSSILANLPAGQYTQAPLVAAANGLFYSSIAHRMDPVSLFSIGVHEPLRLYAPQTIDPMPTEGLPDGSLLGIAVTVSSDPVYSLVKCGLDGKVTTLRQFPEGERLPHTAFLGSDGSYYGVSMLPDGAGYIYSLAPSSDFKKLLSFPANSFHGNPVDVPLVDGGDGKLYGATTSGGPQGGGTVYELSTGGRYRLLHGFPRTESSFSPMAMIEASDGNLYGATLGFKSQLFRVSKSGQFTLLHAMDRYTEGTCPCRLVQGSDGGIYGTAGLGGATGLGSIFVWNGGLPKPRPQALRARPEAGAAGAEILIWGRNLLGAAVGFQGVSTAAQVSLNNSSYIRATVPPGASSGPIAITTPGGSARTNLRFEIQRRQGNTH